ncbi:MAG: acyl-CoA dehydratase activase-related protein [Candidatus Lokiarchaeota archaeon]
MPPNNDYNMKSEIKKPRVGVPRALHYYRYYPFWKKLLEELGVEVILSPPTNKKTVETGVQHGFGELCIPMKVYYGHVMKLIEKYPDLDYIFVPRYVAEVKDAYFCPKFISLPDVIKILPETPKILNFEVNVKEFPLTVSAIDLGQQLGKSENKSLEAYQKAKKYFEEYHEFLRQGASVNYALNLVHRNKPFKMPKRKVKGDMRLLLLGHGYNLFDTFINLDFKKKLSDRNVNVLTIENMPESVFKIPVVVNKKLHNYWRHEEEIMQAIRYFLTKGRDEIDGVIFLISFACGPDSLISELIMRDMKVVGLPFLEITMDEHSGEAGMLTRIESFVEMIRRKKDKLEATKESQKRKITVS